MSLPNAEVRLAVVPKLKAPSQCHSDTCDAVRCQRHSEMILGGLSAAMYSRDRVELCDKHYEVHCDNN